jgi:hypothetical protein
MIDGSIAIYKCFIENDGIYPRKGQWPCNTPSENSLKSKTNTRTEKTMLKLVKIQSLRKISLISRTL